MEIKFERKNAYNCYRKYASMDDAHHINIGVDNNWVSVIITDYTSLLDAIEDWLADHQGIEVFYLYIINIWGCGSEAYIIKEK